MSIALAPTSYHTIVVIPDTQIEVQDYPACIEAQRDWILANRVNHNISAVLHMGDLVHLDNDTDQWDYAEDIMADLEAVLPTAICAGNHDTDYPVSNLEFITRFGPARYAGFPWYGAHRAGEADYYITWTAGGVTYIAICMAYHATVVAAAVTWADGIMAANPNAVVILCNHMTLGGGYPAPWVSTDLRTNMFEVLDGRANFRTMLAGHALGQEGRRDEVQSATRTIYVTQQNWQDEVLGGYGRMRLYRIYSDGACRVQTMSPYYDEWYDDDMFVVGGLK